MPHTEVCMHMRVHNRRMQVELVACSYGYMAQLYTLDGQIFSLPITTGEAGIYEDQTGHYAYVAE